MSFLGENNFSHENEENIGVLICNLGTPDSYSVSHVRAFLREFLSLLDNWTMEMTLPIFFSNEL